MCPLPKWEQPVFLNITAPVDLQQQSGQQNLDEQKTSALLRRKLESQKGEVRSLGSL